MWLAFKGNGPLNYDTPGEAGIPAGYHGTKIVNMGGGSSPNGQSNFITKANLIDVGNRAAELKSAGWDGVSFDLESMVKSDWSAGATGTQEIVDTFQQVFNKLHAQNVFTLVTLAHDGQTAELYDGLPEGQKTLLAIANMDGIDVFSPQCYSEGGETGSVDKVCGWPWDVGGTVMKQWRATYVVPSMSRAFVTQQSDPLAALQAWPNWNPDSQVIGYIEWPVSNGGCIPTV